MKKLFNLPGRAILLGLLFNCANQLTAQITTNALHDTIKGVGQISYDFDGDSNDDFLFEILELSPDVYGARVVTLGNSEFLDNSTFGYPDAFDQGETMSGYYNTGNGVLGTFHDGAHFKNVGFKYLGVKIVSGAHSYYGWVKLSCNETNDTLIIESYGYNTVSNDEILAGETTVTSLEVEDNISLVAYPNPASERIYVTNYHKTGANYRLYDLTGQMVQQGVIDEFIELSGIMDGQYVLVILEEGYTSIRKIEIYH